MLSVNKNEWLEGQLGLSLLLSHFSRVRLCATPEMAAHQAPVPGILQARTLKWVAISFSNAWKWNLYADQKATVRTEHGTTDWFLIGKGVCQGCILSPCLFNFYAEYIMRNAGLEETQAGIKITGRNIKNLRYADDTTFMAESEELKSLLKVYEESEKLA